MTVELVCQELVLVVVSVIVSALVVRLARDPHTSPLPYLIKSPTFTLAYFLCLSNYSSLVCRLSSIFTTWYMRSYICLGLVIYIYHIHFLR